MNRNHANWYSLAKLLERYGKLSVELCNIFIFHMECKVLYATGTPNNTLIEFEIIDQNLRFIENIKEATFERVFNFENGFVELKPDTEKFINDEDYECEFNLYVETSVKLRKILAAELDGLPSAEVKAIEFIKNMYISDFNMIDSGSLFTFYDILKIRTKKSEINSLDVGLFEHFSEFFFLQRHLDEIGFKSY